MPIKNKSIPIEKNEFFKFNIKKQDIKPELSSNLEKTKKVKRRMKKFKKNLKCLFNVMV